MTNAEIDSKIAGLERAIASPATPEAQKEGMRNMIAKLKAMKKEEKPAEPKKEPEKKPESKKAEGKKPEKKAEPKKEPEKKPEPKKKDDYDCDDLIAKAKKQRAAAKKAAAKRAEEPKHSPTTKDRMAIEKVAQRITGNVKKRIEKKQMKRDELQRLIKETKDFLRELEGALKKL